jgi:hypothetical protein
MRLTFGRRAICVTKLPWGGKANDPTIRASSSRQQVATSQIDKFTTVLILGSCLAFGTRLQALP